MKGLTAHTFRDFSRVLISMSFLSAAAGLYFVYFDRFELAKVGLLTSIVLALWSHWFKGRRNTSL